MKIFIIQANFYQDISQLLLEGAEDAITKAKITNNCNIDFEVITVAGALEIPASIAMIANSIAKNYSNNLKAITNIGFVALGCVIRGETSHYDIVCNESARGLNDLAVNNLLPIANGIITVENKQQALARASKNQKNKGGFAVDACIKMINLKNLYH